jgi:hypothetical protein
MLASANTAGERIVQQQFRFAVGANYLNHARQKLTACGTFTTDC